jgi:hypothetical protein
MARLARVEVFDADEIAVVHVMNPHREALLLDGTRSAYRQELRST